MTNILPTLGFLARTYSEAKFLGMFSTKLPADLEAQLKIDGGVDLSLNTSVRIDELISSVSRGEMPKGNYDELLFSLSSMGGYYEVLIAKNTDTNAWKVAYISSLCLHCIAAGKLVDYHQILVAMRATSRLTIHALENDIATRFEILGFISWVFSALYPLLPQAPNLSEAYVLSSLCIAALIDSLNENIVESSNSHTKEEVEQVRLAMLHNQSLMATLAAKMRQRWSRDESLLRHFNQLHNWLNALEGNATTGA